MKNIVLILFVCMGCSSFAQKPSNNLMSGELKYTAQDSIITNAEKNTIHLYGRATFEHDGVNFQARDIMINKNTNKVIATGLIAVVFVPMIKRSVNSTDKILKYTMGERFVQIE